MGIYYSQVQDKQNVCALTSQFNIGPAIYTSGVLDADSPDNDAYFEYPSFTSVSGWSTVVDTVDRSADSNETLQSIGDTLATLVQDLLTAGVLTP